MCSVLVYNRYPVHDDFILPFIINKNIYKKNKNIYIKYLYVGKIQNLFILICVVPNISIYAILALSIDMLNEVNFGNKTLKPKT